MFSYLWNFHNEIVFNFLVVHIEIVIFSALIWKNFQVKVEKFSNFSSFS